MSKYLDLAKKLKALADRGEGGEKDQAKRALDRLIKKHGLRPEDLEEDKQFDVRFKVEPQHLKIFIQIAAMVCGIKRQIFTPRKKRKADVIMSVSISEQLEIESMFHFYSKEYDKQLEVFNSAFIQANNLYPTNTSVTAKEISAEELRKRQLASIMAEGIESSEFRKQLTS